MKGSLAYATLMVLGVAVAAPMPIINTPAGSAIESVSSPISREYKASPQNPDGPGKPQAAKPTIPNFVTLATRKTPAHLLEPTKAPKLNIKLISRDTPSHQTEPTKAPKPNNTVSKSKPDPVAPYMVLTDVPTLPIPPIAKANSTSKLKPTIAHTIPIYISATPTRKLKPTIAHTIPIYISATTVTTSVTPSSTRAPIPLAFFSHDISDISIDAGEITDGGEVTDGGPSDTEGEGEFSIDAGEITDGNPSDTEGEGDIDIDIDSAFPSLFFANDEIPQGFDLDADDDM